MNSRTTAPGTLITAGLGILLVLGASGDAGASAWYQDMLTGSCCHESYASHWCPPTNDCIARILERMDSEYEYAQHRVVGESADGRLIHALRIAHDGTGTPYQKPVVLFTGAIHGNERAPARVLLDWTDYILDSAHGELSIYHGSGLEQPGDLTLNDLIVDYEIWVIPVLNPDGYSDPTVSVNCPVMKPARLNGRGVNLATDFPLNWRLRPPAPDKCAVSGSEPLSQPETRALAGLAEQIGPRVYVDVHGYSRWPLDNETGELDSSQMNWWATVPYRYYQSYIDDDEITYVAVAPGPSDAWEINTDEANLAVSTDILRYVRNTEDAVFFRYSLPDLASASAIVSGFPTRKYSPWAADISDFIEINWGHYRTTGRNQPHGYMAARFGAVSFLYELVGRDLHSEIDSVGDIVWSYGSSYFEPPDETTELRASSAIRDSFVPLSFLVSSSRNPIPASHPNHQMGSRGLERNNLAVSALHAATGRCDLLATFWPVYGRTGLATDESNVRVGIKGSKEITCAVTNYGNKSLYSQDDDFSVRIQIDRFDPSTHSWNLEEMRTFDVDASVLSGLASTIVTTQFDFTGSQAHYRVSCEVLDTAGQEYMNETDAGSITVMDDLGCETASSYKQIHDFCTSTSTESRTWKTNNYRQIEFKAALEPQAFCNFDKDDPSRSEVRPHNMNGYPTGHIAPITAFGHVFPIGHIASITALGH